MSTKQSHRRKSRAVMGSVSSKRCQWASPHLRNGQELKIAAWRWEMNSMGEWWWWWWWSSDSEQDDELLDVTAESRCDRVGVRTLPFCARNDR